MDRRKSLCALRASPRMGICWACRIKLMTAGSSASSDTPRVVVTGVGVVSPIGIGNETFWGNLIEGRTGIAPLRAFPNLNLPSKLAAEVADFAPQKYLRDRKMLKVMSRD